MSDFQNIKITELSDTVQKILKENASTLTKKVKELSKTTAKDLTSNTKKDAPVRTKEFKKHISYKLTKENSTTSIYSWYVKDPEYRLTHLIAKGHDLYVGSGTRNKIPKKVGRIKENAFLEKNLDVAQKKFEEGVEKIIKDGV